MKDRTLSPVFYFVRFYEWTRKADKENNLNGCFPAVARQGESTSLAGQARLFSLREKPFLQLRCLLGEPKKKSRSKDLLFLFVS